MGSERRFQGNILMIVAQWIRKCQGEHEKAALQRALGRITILWNGMEAFIRRGGLFSDHPKVG